MSFRKETVPTKHRKNLYISAGSFCFRMFCMQLFQTIFRVTKHKHTKRSKQSMTQNELNEIIEKHQHYLNRDIDGWENMRADLSNKILYEANLRRSDLRNADFREASLFGAPSG